MIKFTKKCTSILINNMTNMWRMATQCEKGFMTDKIVIRKSAAVQFISNDNLSREAHQTEVRWKMCVGKEIIC